MSVEGSVFTVPLGATEHGAHSSVENSRPRGKTLVILGNGPSLAGFDFSRFRGFDAIGMNAAYRYWDRIGWYPRYYICLDAIVGRSHRGEIERLIGERQRNGIELFVLRKDLVDQMPAAIRDDDRVLLFEHLRETSALFSPMPFTTGSHAALVGAMLGYEQMILMGIDGDYVERIDEAKARSKDVLEILKTPKSNPNYFFAGYQVEGDQYTVPNPIPNLHVDCWRAVSRVMAERNVKVWNGSKESRVDSFPFRSFADLESHEGAGSIAHDGIETHVPLRFEQAAKAYVDETAIIAKLFADRKGDRHTFVDIGAKPDGAAAEFRKLGWRVLSLAASDLGAIARTTEPSAIDVLRISVGGDALALVKTLPWDRVKPDAIECRFGSSGTEALASACQDTAEFLVRAKYAVYISEWHRNLRTGARHDWCQLKKSPTSVLAPEAWGNILAFKADPGAVTLEQTFRACLQFEGTEYMLAKAPIAQSHEPKPAKPAPAPVSPGPSQAHESLVAVDLKGYLNWSANFARRHPAVLAGFAVLFLALLVAASLPGSQSYRMALWLLVEALAFGWVLATGIGYAGTLARKVDRRLERQRGAVIDHLSRSQKQAAEASKRNLKEIASLTARLNKVAADASRAIQAEARRVDDVSVRVDRIALGESPYVVEHAAIAPRAVNLRKAAATEPTFSIIIPTHNRAITLRSALRTCVEVDHPNFEVVVSDNASSDDTADVVAAFDDPRIRYVRTPEFVSMSRNFENGLKHSRGEFPIFVGDDDGVMPFCLRVLEAKFKSQPHLDVIDWIFNPLLWPHKQEVDLPLNWISNLRGHALETDEQAWHRTNHPRSIEYNELSGFNLYHGCVRRRVLEAAIAAGAPVFDLPVPDVGAALRVLRFAKRKLQLDVALTINATSKMSTGLAQASTQPSDRQKQILSDFESQTAVEFPNSVFSRYSRNRPNAFFCSLIDEHLERRGDLAQLNLRPWRFIYLDYLVRLPEEQFRALLPEVNALFTWCGQKGAANAEPLTEDDVNAYRPVENRLPHLFNRPFRFSEAALAAAASAPEMRRARITDPRIVSITQRRHDIAVKARSASEEFTVHDFVHLTAAVMRCTPFDTTKLLIEDPSLFRSRVVQNVLGHLLADKV